MSVNVKIAPNNAATAMTGRVSGIVTSNMRRQKPAPSTRAASSMSWGRAITPASTMTAAGGTSRQTCTAMTDTMASDGLPSQYMFASRSPSCRSTQSIGLKIESRSHSQETVDNATGVVQGSRMRKRTIHLPRKSASRMLARILPNSTMSTIEMTVMTSVLRSDCQKTGSSKARRKASSPTQSNDGSPAVTSLKANPIASTNGTATRATTYTNEGRRKSQASSPSRSASRLPGGAPVVGGAGWTA